MRPVSFGFVAVSIALLASTAPADAQTLSFQPQRIVMDARTGSAAMTMTNTGKRPEGYRVELVDMIYGEDGSVRPAPQTPAGYPSAKSLIRFSPSQIRLNPGEQQKVRILIMQQQKLPDGEYRVHAVLRQLPNVTEVAPAAASKNTVAGVVGVQQSVAIPVIVRAGVTSASGAIASAKLVTQGKGTAADLMLTRNGNRSLYTNLQVKDRAGAIVHTIKGVAVPVPNAKRRFVYDLQGADPAKLRAGGLVVEMVDHDSGAVIDKKPLQ